MKGVAVVPQGLEEEGAKELKELGAISALPKRRTVLFETDMGGFYRFHLQARLPFRLLREMASFQCFDRQSLYAGVQDALDWDAWLNPSMTFRVDITGINSGLRHSHFTALEVKNALVDFQRQRWGARSDINLKQPDICLHLHLHGDRAVLSLDGSSSSLHRRGHRAAMGMAPLKENVALGLLRLSGWKPSKSLIDPFCGSGTLLIEAASLAMGLAPGLERSFLLDRWADFDLGLWKKEQDFARRLQKKDIKLPPIIGCEEDSKISTYARYNVESAGLTNVIQIKNSHFRDLVIPDGPGLIICNPPYGKRLGIEDDLLDLYEELGCFLKKNASGWELWLLSGNPKLTRSLKMKSTKRIPISNGGLDCRWLKYQIN